MANGVMAFMLGVDTCDDVIGVDGIIIGRNRIGDTFGDDDDNGIVSLLCMVFLVSMIRSWARVPSKSMLFSSNCNNKQITH